MPILFWMQLISRYPERKIGSINYLLVPQIAALRLKLITIIKPQAVRIVNNGNILSEIKLNHAPENQSFNKVTYLNLWVNLIDSTFTGDKLRIECQYFGIYIPVKTIHFIVNEDLSRISESESFVDPTLLRSPTATQKILEDDILNFPSVTYSTLTKDISTQIKRILLLRLDQLGDFVLTLPAVHELKIKNPDVEITILVSPANTDLAKSCGLFDHVFAIPFSFIEKTNIRELSQEAIDAVISSVGNKTYDVAADLSPMPETRKLLSQINSNLKYGFENTDSSMIDYGILVHTKDPINHLSIVNHETYPLLLVDAINRSARPYGFHIPKIDAGAAILAKLDLASKEYIVVHSGARNLLVRWPLENFVSLALELENIGHKIVFFSDEPLNFENKKMLSARPRIHVVDLKLSFDEFDTILSNAKLFIGNDSGPKHLSALRAIPVISLHSPRTNWREWGQVDSGYVITSRIPCAGCAIITHEECARDLICIKKIRSDEVMSLVHKCLES
jgi:ADP-heptose:LPS heptosyltransferase